MSDSSMVKRLLVLASLSTILATACSGDAEALSDSNADRATSSPIYLSDLSWDWATTGWVALADDNLPKLDTSFINQVLVIGDRSYDKGLGTYPLSEIVYQLGGKYRLFRSDVGVDGSVPDERGSVIFKAFVDDALAYDSGVLHAGQAPEQMEIPLTGAKSLRLVVEDAGDGSAMDYADWANARLFPADSPPPQGDGAFNGTLQAERDAKRLGRASDWRTIAERSQQTMEVVSRVLQRTGVPSSQSVAAYDPDSQQIVVANDRLALVLGYGGERHGLLDILDLASRQLVAHDTSPSLTVDGLGIVALGRNTEPLADGGFGFQRIQVPAMGPGLEVALDFLVPDSDVSITERIDVFDAQPYLTTQFEVRSTMAGEIARRFAYFDPQEGGSFVVGEDTVYLTDSSLIRRGEVHDDGILRREQVGLGKPLLLFSRAQSRGLMMAVIDESPDPARFGLQVDGGKVSGKLEFAYPLASNVEWSGLQFSPRLFFQVIQNVGLSRATEQFKAIMSALYPQPPLPDWVKYQWGTWYAFYMDYDEDTIKDQIDYIAQNLSDLGPWSVLLDAGWYVADGRPDSTWDNVDEEKFPNGLRALVDYAHVKGIRVILYFSAPYLDDRDREWNWLGLRGFIEQHPDWVIRLQSDATGSSYVYDFHNPQLVDYMRGLIHDFFTAYNVDGIKIDGLGQAEGEQLSMENRDIFGDVNAIRMFTMDVYRLVHEEAMKAGKDVYIESGWATPNFANRYAHTFRYGDEHPSLQNRYPSGGLLEHIDYAALQKAILGQRPNMGMVWGGTEAQPMIRQWFEAALAEGSQMTMSIDLTRLSPRDLSALRAVLVHYNAFQGDTRFVGLPFPRSFATTSNGITYLAAVNRTQEAREVTFNLADYGLDQRPYLLYDVASNHYSRVQGSFSARVTGESFRLFLLRDAPGMVWTNSSYTAQTSPNSLKIDVDGPISITGFAQLYAPRPASVRLDGRPLDRSSTLGVGSGYLYDDATGVLRLRYRHDRPHTIEVNY